MRLFLIFWWPRVNWSRRRNDLLNIATIVADSHVFRSAITNNQAALPVRRYTFYWRLIRWVSLRRVSAVVVIFSPSCCYLLRLQRSSKFRLTRYFWQLLIVMGLLKKSCLDDSLIGCLWNSLLTRHKRKLLIRRSISAQVNGVPLDFSYSLLYHKLVLAFGAHNTFTHLNCLVFLPSEFKQRKTTYRFKTTKIKCIVVRHWETITQVH